VRRAGCSLQNVRAGTALDAGLYRAPVVEIAKNARRGVVAQFHNYFISADFILSAATAGREPALSEAAGDLTSGMEMPALPTVPALLASVQLMSGFRKVPPERLARSYGMTSVRWHRSVNRQAQTQIKSLPRRGSVASTLEFVLTCPAAGIRIARKSRRCGAKLSQDRADGLRSSTVTPQGLRRRRRD